MSTSLQPCEGVETELFRGHNAPMLLLGFIHNCRDMITVDNTGRVIVWKYTRFVPLPLLLLLLLLLNQDWTKCGQIDLLDFVTRKSYVSDHYNLGLNDLHPEFY